MKIYKNIACTVVQFYNRVQKKYINQKSKKSRTHRYCLIYNPITMTIKLHA